MSESAGEFWTDAEQKALMHDLLAEFYQSALGSLEKQINDKKSADNAQGRANHDQLQSEICASSDSIPVVILCHLYIISC